MAGRPEDVPEALRSDGRSSRNVTTVRLGPETDGEYYISLTVKDHDGFADRR